MFVLLTLATAVTLVVQTAWNFGYQIFDLFDDPHGFIVNKCSINDGENDSWFMKESMF